MFDRSDYRDVIRDCIQKSKRARGELARLCAHIGLHTTTLSQILSGKKPMSPEHGISVCDYFGFTELETRYFLLLIQLDRAGTARLRKALEKQIAGLREESRSLAARIPTKKKLTKEQQTTFYSHWLYSAIRVASSLPGLQTEEELAAHFGIERKTLRKYLDFLLDAQLCVINDGKIEPGPSYTHLDSQSPLIARHHANWRIKALEKHVSLGDAELAYTAPMSLSRSDANLIRSKLLAIIQEVQAIRDPSPSETTYFFNVDWLEF